MIWTTRPRSDLGHGLTGHRSGSGPLVILIHGVGLRLEAWNAITPLIEPHFTVLAIDMPGHGGSAPVGSATLDAFTAPFAALIQDHGPACVAGHSMGAMIALDLASRLPDLVRGCAALNAIYRRTATAAAAVRDRAAALAGATLPDPGPTLHRWFGPDDTPEARACRDWLTSADPGGYARAYATFAQHDGPSDAALSGLIAPTLFLTGAHDPNSTPDMSAAMAHRVPNGRAVILPDAAHMAPMTHPSEIARDLIATFTGAP